MKMCSSAVVLCMRGRVQCRDDIVFEEQRLYCFACINPGIDSLEYWQWTSTDFEHSLCPFRMKLVDFNSRKCKYIHNLLDDRPTTISHGCAVAPRRHAVLETRPIWIQASKFEFKANFDRQILFPETRFLQGWFVDND